MPETTDATTQLGDYQLGRIVAEGSRTITYEADQISVRRKVLLERVKPEQLGDEGVVEGFLRDVRAKAELDYPVIASVYEAVRGEDTVFFVREKPPGRSLAELVEAEECLEPRQVLQLLVRLGEACVYLSEHHVRTEGLQPRDLYFEEPDVLRMDNMVVAGSVNVSARRRDREMISTLLGKLVAEGQPGATRTWRLLELLTGEDPPNWPSVAHTARKLAHDLADSSREGWRPAPALVEESRGLSPRVMVLAGLIVLLAIAAVGGAYFLGGRGSSVARPLGQMVEITGGKVFGADGEAQLLPSFWIDAHEVTVAEYGAFLKALEVIAEDQRHAYNHELQPEGKEGHVPADWEALQAAIEDGGKWEGLVVGQNCPVVNVDWWDAFAYANWRGGRLPTQAEWFAAAEGATPEGSGWGAVDFSEVDRTPGGVMGLAGNATEWISDSALNPAFPMNQKGPVSCGASYLQPKNGSLARLWHADREARRADLGIRVVRDTAP